MANIYEEISKSQAQSNGKTDSNLANDSNHLGGVPAEQYATKKYVKDYHDNKEASQKEYIDEQDNKVLQEAKEYANSQIRNQDFSSFAKLTDVQAVDTKLSNKIEECRQQCATNLATQIKAVVDDTNANFDDVNNAITTLNNTTNQLFQSVSNGKSKIAGAITDKGVPTSANDSYDTMAGNIRSIQTGGGEIDENFVNTSDGTATASDILLGKTAYAQGNKIYGTLIAQAEEGMPTYGTDTSNATATEEDIAYGKTAYARGKLLVGIASGNPSGTVEEIYGANAEGYTQNSQSILQKDPITGEDILSGSISFSQDLGYCVRIERINNNIYIGSYAVDNGGLYIQQSSSIEGNIGTKKYRYTKSDLGISESASIYSIRLGAKGLGGSENKCLLQITTQETIDGLLTIKLHLYTYHLSDNGQIGALYSGENVIEIHQTILSVNNSSGNSYSSTTIPFNNKYNQFYYLQYKFYTGNATYTIKNYKIINNNLIEIGNEQTYTDLLISSMNYLTPTYDDKYITGCAPSDNRIVIIKNNTNDEYYSPQSFDVTSGVAPFIFINNNRVLKISYSSNKINYKIVDEDNEYTIYGSGFLYDNSGTATDMVLNAIITPDNKTLIVITKTPKVYIYNMQKLLNGASTVKATQQFDAIPVSGSSSSNSFYFFNMNVNNDGSKILMYNNFYQQKALLYKLFTTLDTENIIGIKYKNQYFYNVKQYNLTAGQPDVRTGKTFIGWQGYPETGTMEVTES